MRRTLAIAIMLLTTIGSATASVLEISEITNSAYQEYLKLIGSTKRGAFAVSPDGIYSYYIHCLETQCESGINSDALQECKMLSGQDCIIMASNRTLRVDIKVAPRRVKLSPTDETMQFILDAERLRELVEGNTLSGEYPNGNKWVEFYDTNGDIRGKDDKQGAYQANYSFDGDEICFDYAGTDGDWCSQVSARGNKIEFVEDGDLVAFVRNTIMQPGNPNGL